MRSNKRKILLKNDLQQNYKCFAQKLLEWNCFQNLLSSLKHYFVELTHVSG